MRVVGRKKVSVKVKCEAEETVMSSIGDTTSTNTAEDASTTDTKTIDTPTGQEVLLDKDVDDMSDAEVVDKVYINIVPNLNQEQREQLYQRVDNMRQQQEQQDADALNAKRRSDYAQSIIKAATELKNNLQS